MKYKAKNNVYISAVPKVAIKNLSRYFIKHLKSKVSGIFCPYSVCVCVW